MKAAELRTKSEDALRQELASLLKAQFSLRMQKATQQLTNHSQLGNTRRNSRLALGREFACQLGKRAMATHRISPSLLSSRICSSYSRSTAALIESR